MVGSDVSILLFAGGNLVYADAAPAGQMRTAILTYDDLGDMLYRIDQYIPSGVSYEFLIETYTEERPQETP